MLGSQSEEVSHPGDSLGSQSEEVSHPGDSIGFAVRGGKSPRGQ